MKKVYKVGLPITARRRLVEVTNPDSERIFFGIHSIKEVVTQSGPGFQVSGSEFANDWADPKYTDFLVDVGQIKNEKGLGVACFSWRDGYWVRAVRPDRKPAQSYGKRGQHTVVQYILLPVKLEPQERSVDLKKFLYEGGCIRFNRDTKQITLVRDSQDLTGTIPCTEADVWNLINDKVAEFHMDTPVRRDLSLGQPEMVLTAADVYVTVTQRDREVFAFLLDHWDESNPGLPGRMSYQDVYDLAAKFGVPEPHRTNERLAKMEAFARKCQEQGGAT